MPISKESANDALHKLDSAADLIRVNASKWGIPDKVALSLQVAMDHAADLIEAEAFGAESLANHQNAVVAKVIQKDSDEPYMNTFANPMAPILTNADEPYMQAYADDQSSAVRDGKSSTGVKLAPLGGDPWR